MNDSKVLLQTIVALSHEFGTPDYIQGGGGNSSCKCADTLWIKPSGTTLAGLTTAILVAMDRARLSRLYSVPTPPDAAAREELVKNMMAEAVKPETPGRASVEAPLHDSFSAAFIVHTHPPLVNALTCSRECSRQAARLFPEAMWVPYVDPGYTLCMRVRGMIAEFRARRGREPDLILLENHGIFVAADTADDVRRIYASVMDRLQAAYRTAGIPTALRMGAPAPAAEVSRTEALIRRAFGEDAAAVVCGGIFAVAEGPLTPDHLVYSKAYPFGGPLTENAAAEFKALRGYAPRVILTEAGVFAIGPSEKTATLAMDLAQDGALVFQLSEAFGGIQYLGDEARSFIENWEVEAYRMKQLK